MLETQATKWKQDTNQGTITLIKMETESWSIMSGTPGTQLKQDEKLRDH